MSTIDKVTKKTRTDRIEIVPLIKLLIDDWYLSDSLTSDVTPVDSITPPMGSL